MAYLDKLNRECESPGCKSEATHKVYGRWGDCYGSHCEKCADAHRERLQWEEENQDQIDETESLYRKMKRRPPEDVKGLDPLA